MIDWLNPSDDVLEARRVGYRVGYEERDAELGDEIERLRAECEMRAKEHVENCILVDRLREALLEILHNTDRPDIVGPARRALEADDE